MSTAQPCFIACILAKMDNPEFRQVAGYKAICGNTRPLINILAVVKTCIKNTQADYTWVSFFFFLDNLYGGLIVESYQHVMTADILAENSFPGPIILPFNVSTSVVCHYIS